MAGPFEIMFIAAALTGASVPGQANAQAGPIVDAEMGESQLHRVHGDADASVDPTADRLEAFDRTQSIAWVQLDNWFSEDGAEIIAANIARDTPAIPTGF
ncbi:hypothetical protein GGR88_001260 [Sphingomonas jejuensis]|uniref:Uncharacterized protein n=1 Tax=Sphingomonas jejuensis TaxID=904715 RepID=A0ABX0XM74_9SPHN|nr:hypothetical protein [Sphingomonas jejuensis]NJC33786.1 hypothetical protein [Sphingomonas jejuensis]